jgi:hypothetical protein
MYDLMIDYIQNEIEIWIKTDKKYLAEINKQEEMKTILVELETLEWIRHQISYYSNSNSVHGYGEFRKSLEDRILYKKPFLYSTNSSANQESIAIEIHTLETVLDFIRKIKIQSIDI